MKRFGALALTLTAAFAAACSSSSSGSSSSNGDGGSSADATYEKQVTTGMRDSIEAQLIVELGAVKEIMDAAPTPADRGWDATLDADAIAKMKTSWGKARSAYEQIEGALAPLFPDVDYATDARYDDFLATIGSAGDQDLFDDQGVTGLHAIERILYADQIPASVVKFESGLAGYKAAAFPATAAEAADFKNKLVKRLVTDVTNIAGQWKTAQLDLGGAFDGLTSLMNEQQEKVRKAAQGEEESRYSQHTLQDLRDNLAGTRAVYGYFAPWIKTKTGGAAADTKIQAGFDTLAAAYAVNSGEAIPEPPATWSSDDPSPDDLKTPFGVLFSTVENAVDPTKDGSVVDEMNDAARALGYAAFAE